LRIGNRTTAVPMFAIPVPKVRTRSTPVTLESFEDSRDGGQLPQVMPSTKSKMLRGSSRCSGSTARDL
jgi:hypothetical protein